MKAIRAYCIRCAGFTIPLAEACAIEDCPLWFYRHGMGFRSKTYPRDGKPPTGMPFRPLKAIRRHCMECMMGSSNQVKLCLGHGGDVKAGQPPCELHPFRFGKRPATVAKAKAWGAEMVARLEGLRQG
jgi:hypothetical protein